MFKKWSEKTPSPPASSINLNTVNLSSSTLKVTTSPPTTNMSHLNRPSLLRRSRASGPPNNPLLNHFLLGLGDTSSKVFNPALSPSSSAAVIRSDSDGVITTATLQHTPASDLPPVSAILRKAPPAPALEEIIIWQPETSECEIVEVEHGDLARYLQEKRDPGMDIQEIIVCSNPEEEEAYDGEGFGNYVVQVFQESPEAEEEFIPAKNDTPEDDGSNLPPPPKKARSSRSKKLISLIAASAEEEGSFVFDQQDVSAAAALGTKKRKSLVDIKCLEPDCDVMVHSVHDLRFHLQQVHGMSFHEETIHFETQEAFKHWRTAYEQEHKVSFIYRGGTKKISAEKAVTYLICHRSGVYKPAMTETQERKRKMKPQGSCKIGSHCTAGIKVVKYLTTTAIDATVCHTHYGHELNNQHLRLTGAIKEIVLQKFHEGRSFPEVLQYIHHNPDGIDGLRLVDRRAIRNIYDQWRKLNAHVPTVQMEDPGTLETEDFPEEHLLVAVEFQEKESASDVKTDESQSSLPTQDESSEVSAMTRGRRKSPRTRRKSASSLSPSTATKEEILEPSPTSLDAIVTRLLEHGTFGSSPTVLLYKKEGEPKPEIGDGSRLHSLESMCLVIQTPIQRQLLEEFSPIIHLELVQGTDMDILVVVILDEFLMAIPVAWMITNSATDELIQNFFQILQMNCAGISCDYLFATRKSGLHELWSKVFPRKPRALYPQEDVFRELKIFLRKHYDEVLTRGQVYDILEKMVQTPEKVKFDAWLRSLKQMVKNFNFWNAFQTHWLEGKGRWAFHTRTQIHPALEESFLKLRKFILFKGTKSLDRNLEDILKIGYDKCFQHDKSLFKGDIKLCTQLENFSQKHVQSSECYWSIQRTPGSGKYTVNGEFEVFDLRTICLCKFRCGACDMCVHQLLCSCGDAHFCLHVHAVKTYLDLNPEVRDPLNGEEELAKDDESKSADFPEASWSHETLEVDSVSDADDPPDEVSATYDGDVGSEDPSCIGTHHEGQTVKQGSPKKESVGGDEDDLGEDTTSDLLPIEIEGVITTDPPRRISTRLQKKRGQGRQFVSAAAGRGRGLKRTHPSSPSHLDAKRSSGIPSEVQETSRGKLKEKRLKGNDNQGEQNDLRNEMLRLIDQIQTIQDPKVLNQVKKKVTSISNLLQK